MSARNLNKILIFLSGLLFPQIALGAGEPPPGAPGPETQPCGPDPDPPGSPGHLECAACDGCQDN